MPWGGDRGPGPFPHGLGSGQRARPPPAPASGGVARNRPRNKYTLRPQYTSYYTTVRSLLGYNKERRRAGHRHRSTLEDKQGALNDRTVHPGAPKAIPRPAPRFRARSMHRCNKYGSFEEVGGMAYAALEASRPAGSPPMLACPWPLPAAASRPEDVKKESVDVVPYDATTGAVRPDYVLRDRGFVVDAVVRATMTAAGIRVNTIWVVARFDVARNVVALRPRDANAGADAEAQAATEKLVTFANLQSRFALADNAPKKQVWIAPSALHDEVKVLGGEENARRGLYLAGMRQALAGASGHVADFAIRLQPGLGLFTKNKVKKGVSLPIASPNILFQAAAPPGVGAFKVAAGVWVAVKGPQKIPGAAETYAVNFASAVRLVKPAETDLPGNTPNAEMRILNAVVVISLAGQAKEHSVGVPHIITTKAVDKDTEVVCLIKPAVYEKAARETRPQRSGQLVQDGGGKRARKDPAADPEDDI